MIRRASLILVAAALSCGFLFAADSVAGEKVAGEKPAPAKKAKAKAKPHLDFKRNYGAALKEARIRNLPVFVSRHKDF